MAQHQPKQYLQLQGRCLLDWSVAALLSIDDLRGCVVALPHGDLERRLGGTLADARVSVCAGGASRADSVAAGLASLPAADEDWVMVHDAARPCLHRSDLQRLIVQVKTVGVGGLLALPVSDTLKRADSEARVLATIDREAIWSAQTPQMFRVGELRAALSEAKSSGRSVTDEASAMEHAGYPVQLVRGSPANLKVTYAVDLELAEFWLGKLASESAVLTGGDS